MDKHGFIYIWFDRKRKMFYLGCHWGTEDDGYICSSKRMRNAYTYRKEDFKRRVIQRHYGTRVELLEIEHRWLQLILDSDVGKKYYNLSKKHFGHWSATPNAAKIQAKMTGRKRTPEFCQLMSDMKKGKKSVPCSEEKKAKISAANKGRKFDTSWNKGLVGVMPEPWNKGKKLKPSWNAGKKLSPEHRARLSAAKLGKPSPKKGIPIKHH